MAVPDVQLASTPLTRRPPLLFAGSAVAVLGAALVWSYWPTLVGMADRWSGDPQYSHGFLVPLFAGLVLWSRRDRLRAARWQPNLWGVPLLAAALGARLAAATVDFGPLDAFSLPVALAGVVLLVGGTSVLVWCWPGIAFLGFMLPLPYAAERALAQPLRRLATVMSTWALQTLGCPAFADGNVILIEDSRLGVAEACSGLGMLLTFFALATLLALVVRRPRYERLMLVASAVPIAVLANVVRITITGLAYYFWGRHNDAVHLFTDQLAGFVIMMPLALGLLGLELWFLARLFVAAPEPKPLPVFFAR
jgi:exosortase